MPKSIREESVFVINGIEFKAINSLIKHSSHGKEATYNLHLLSPAGAMELELKAGSAHIESLFNPGENFNPEKQKEPGIGQIVRYSGDDWRVVYVTPGISGRVRMTGFFVLRNLSKPEIERTATNPALFGSPEHLTVPQTRMIEMVNNGHYQGFISDARRDQLIEAIKKPE